MRAAVWTKGGELELVDRAAPEPGPGEVSVSVVSGGICGSDLHWFRGDFTPDAGRTPGHEIGGVVAAVGADVDGLREGDVVGIEPRVRCGACDYCALGQFQHCRTSHLIGLGSDGGLADQVLAPAYTAFVAPPGVDGELAALAEPLACSVHGFRKVDLRAGETVLVQGAGTIGLTAVQAAVAEGATVLITARYAHQREAAERLGASEVIMDDDAGNQRLAELGRDQAIDVVAEAVGGHADTIRVAVDVVRPMGRVCVLGVFAIESAGLNPLTLLSKEAVVVGANTYSWPGGTAGDSDYARALEVIAGMPEESRALITHRIPLSEINAGFATAMDKSTASIKVHIQPD